MKRRQPRTTRTDKLVPYTTLCRSGHKEPGRKYRTRTRRDGRARHRRSHRPHVQGRRERSCVLPRSEHRPCTEWTRAPPKCRRGSRSEEHTSALQSLMRISYAVFCFQKKIPTHIDKYKYTKI